MTKLEEIRKEADEMQSLIKAMIQDFIDKNGHCDISINTSVAYYGSDKNRELADINVEVNVTI
jgi:hypothetical protein